MNFERVQRVATFGAIWVLPSLSALYCIVVSFVSAFTLVQILPAYLFFVYLMHSANFLYRRGKGLPADFHFRTVKPDDDLTDREFFELASLFNSYVIAPILLFLYLR
jgi:hypothetical protein